MRRTTVTRRSFLKVASTAAGAAIVPKTFAADGSGAFGYVVGEPTGEKVGGQVLAGGGNAIDAIVAAALAVAVAAPNQTGIGGYGAHGIFAIEGGKRLVALDANSTAPAAMQPDIFKPDSMGNVPGRVNEYGWLAAGVPGILAGLQLALDRFGTRPFSELVQPAIGLARDGFSWPAGLASGIAKYDSLAKDAGSRKLYFREGAPLPGGARFVNPELAELLATLAQANSVESFYRGDIAQRIADGFQKNGGLVTAKDLAAYRARIVEPLAVTWGLHTIHTVPLTSGGLSVLQMLLAMQAMRWDSMPADLQRTQARIEAMRLAWHDRLTLLGDPDFADVPQQRLLSRDYAHQCAERALAAAKAGKAISHRVTSRDHGGTISLSAVDRQGNFAALTLTHGNAFGAQVTVAGLGLTLGHGMSRFDPRPDHPNAPGPGKRPLNNMTPTIVTKGGKPVLAIGGRGGRRIPNAMLECLTQFVVLGRPLAAAIAAPRLHTEGNLSLEFEKSWPNEKTSSLAALGYTVKTANSAVLSAVAVEDGTMRKAMR